eukprot:TRINITY_DN5553_c0_g2_i1.p1 TRINITY_DN5553_c0_g2~~TRINITY_DN5553_c0_g2_i1.p1  ORF type:complete len:421 (-),score=70.43 TRINITY_DN5553_c0_g2_i1:83-1345(-)
MQRVRQDILLIGPCHSGKSHVGGNLLCNQGGIDKRTREKFQRQAQEMGYTTHYGMVMTDLLRGSRSLNFYIRPWVFETQRYTFNILDSFGESDLIVNALSYKQRVGSALLVVSASIKEFEECLEETFSQLEFVYHLGVKQVIVVVNKMDTVEWKEDRFFEITKCLTPHLQQMFTLFSFVPVSSISSDNFYSMSSLSAWYKDLSVVQMLNSLEVTYPPLDPLCVEVQDVFYTKKFGIVLTGYAFSGTLQVNDMVNVLPHNIVTQIKSIQDSVVGVFGQPILSFNISSERFEDFFSKTKLFVASVDNPIYCESAKIFDAIINVKLPVVISEGDSMGLAFGANKVSCKILGLISKFNQSAKIIDHKPNSFKGRALGLARIEVCEHIFIQKFKKHPFLSHFGIFTSKGVLANWIAIDIIEGKKE